MIEEVCVSPAGVLVIEGDARGRHDVRAGGLPRGLRCLRSRGGRLRPCRTRGRAPRGGLGHRIAYGCPHAPPAPGRATSLRRGAPGRRGGTLGDRQLAELVSLAARDDAKLVVVGDPFRLQPIEAGAPMRTLSDQIVRVELHENIRRPDLGGGDTAVARQRARRARRPASTCVTGASTTPARWPSGGSR